MNKLELRRQAIHLLYGPTLVILYSYKLIDTRILLGMIIGGAVASYLIKRQKLTILAKILSFFEREHHMQ